MNCLQCGTELDRLSKWRWSSEYCSEECKKRGEDEFNRLVMSRLMQPRAPRPSTGAAVSPAGILPGKAGPLTVVTHPSGMPVLVRTEPPEAGFLMMEASDLLIGLQFRQDIAALPQTATPRIPSAELPVTGSLLALEEILKNLRPVQRLARPWPAFNAKTLAISRGEDPVSMLPASDPCWPASLGLALRVIGLEDVRVIADAASPSTPGLPAFLTSRPVAHRSIPPRRPARALPILNRFELGGNHPLQPPIPSPPRLRIHLPKPSLSPFRPRYVIAPRPAGETGAHELESEAVPLDREGIALEQVVEAARPIESGTEGRVEANAEPGVAGTGSVSLGGQEVEAAAEAEAELPAAPLLDAPSFGLGGGGEPEGFLGRLPVWLKAAVAFAVLGLAGYWSAPVWQRAFFQSKASRMPAAVAPATLGADSWETGPAAGETGVARFRVINQYKPGRGKRNYIFEFTGQIAERAIGWVFRVKDYRNYYCLKVELTGDGAQLVKFAVVNGEEQTHRAVPLRDPVSAGQPVTVRLIVREQNFATEVNGKPVDVWIDNQISDGTVGFANETGERAIIHAAKVRY